MKTNISILKSLFLLILFLLTFLTACNNQQTNPAGLNSSAGKSEIITDSTIKIKIETPVDENTNFALYVYPNPCKKLFDVSFTLPVNIHLTLSIENIVGDHIYTITDRISPAGAYTFSGDIAEIGLNPGVYMAHLQLPGYSARCYFEVVD